MQTEIVVQRDRIERGIDTTTGEQRLHAGGEAQPHTFERVIQRLDAEAVAGEEQRAMAQVADGEGEHAVEMLDAFFAPGVIGLEDHLAVALREERVAEFFEFLAQFAVVVDGAVEHQHQMQLAVEHRLMRDGVGIGHGRVEAQLAGKSAHGVSFE